MNIGKFPSLVLVGSRTLFSSIYVRASTLWSSSNRLPGLNLSMRKRVANGTTAFMSYQSGMLRLLSSKLRSLDNSLSIGFHHSLSKSSSAELEISAGFLTSHVVLTYERAFQNELTAKIQTGIYTNSGLDLDLVCMKKLSERASIGMGAEISHHQGINLKLMYSLFIDNLLLVD